MGEVLARAEAWAREIRERAERSASEARRTARHEAEGIAAEARAAAEAAAVERVHEISELRASIAARAGSLVEGLEGGELTAARLDELVAALGEAEVRILQEVGGTVEPAKPGKREGPARPTRGGDRDVIAWPARPGERPATATTREGAAEPEPEPEPAAPAAQDVTAPPPAVERAVEPAPRRAGEPIADPLPEGAPIARRPKRASSARFAAVMMAIQGCDRAEVEAHLAREHGLKDAHQLLDDVFGRADATA